MHSYFFYTLLFIALILAPASTLAQTQNKAKPLIKIKKTPYFSLPLDCTLNEDCWVMNYVDIGPDDQKQTDPACQSRTYDNHKGTDFAILDEATMLKGVNIIAPLSGTITKIRDGEHDRWASDEDLEQIKTQRKECGNAVMIDHGDNVQSIYCHMKRGSITVKQNQKIKRGDILGQVGLSGLTQFPHLHFGIIQDSKIIDPFTGQNNQGSCGKMIGSLWKKELEVNYQPFIIQNTGLLNDIPNLDRLNKNGTPPSTIPQDSDLLTFWATLLGVRAGDKITMMISDPNGKNFAKREIIQEKNRARQFYYAGRKTTKNPLIEGVYSGEIKIEREHKGQIISDKKLSAILVIKE